MEFLSLCILCVVSTVSQCQTLVKVGEIHAPHAAFVTLVDNPSSSSSSTSDRFTAIISGFNPIPLFHDYVYKVDDLGARLAARDSDISLSAVQIATDIIWPNEVDDVPVAVFQRAGLMLVAGGFLVPLKNHGSLTLFDLTQAPPSEHKITDDSSADASWFYHRGEWRDMNGDGLLDLVACRAKSHLFGSTEGQLVWFEHPQQDALTQSWTSHVIADGPDTFFTLTSLPTPDGDVDCIITAGFFSQSLNVYWTTHPDKRWDDPAMIQHRVIDDTIGAAFDVTVVDLNVDGNLDLLVTNNALAHASVFAYTIPQDFRTDTFPRQTLSTGYTSRTSGTGHGAPGSAVLVYPSSQSPAGKPWILVSGDDDGQAHLLKPASNEASDWSYLETDFLDVGTGTVGGIGVGDLDNDGYTEVLVPSFNEGLVYIFSFRPETTNLIG